MIDAHDVREALKLAYLEYLNNFLTVEKFAEYYGYSMVQGQTIINLGREFHQEATE